MNLSDQIMKNWREYLLAEQTYKVGMKDSNVGTPDGPIAKIQQQLASMGLLQVKPEELGIYGPKTRNAVRTFQKKVWPNKKSEWDGKVGGRTSRALASGHIEPTPPGKQPPSAGKEVPAKKRTGASAKIDPSDLKFLISSLGATTWVNDAIMRDIHDIVVKYTKTGAITTLMFAYRQQTGDSLPKEIAAISGVEQWKKPTLAMFGKDYKRDLSTKAGKQWDDKKDTVRDLYNLLPSISAGGLWTAIKVVLYGLKEFRVGPPQYRMAFKFASGSTTPFTQKDLTPGERTEISSFLKMIFNAHKKPLGKGKNRAYFKKEALRMKESGVYRFSDAAFGGGHYSYYAAMRQIDAEAGFQVNPASTIGKLKNMLGQFVVEDAGSYWVMKDGFDFNDWAQLSKDDAGFQEYFAKVVNGLEGGKDNFLGRQTKLGKECAKNSGGEKRGLYNAARCWLPIRHALMPGDKYPWETGAFSAYKGFPVSLKIPKS